MLYPTELPDHLVFRVAKIEKSFNKGNFISIIIEENGVSNLKLLRPSTHYLLPKGHFFVSLWQFVAYENILGYG